MKLVYVQKWKCTDQSKKICVIFISFYINHGSMYQSREDTRDYPPWYYVNMHGFGNAASTFGAHRFGVVQKGVAMFLHGFATGSAPKRPPTRFLHGFARAIYDFRDRKCAKASHHQIFARFSGPRS